MSDRLRVFTAVESMVPLLLVHGTFLILEETSHFVKQRVVLPFLATRMILHPNLQSHEMYLKNNLCFALITLYFLLFLSPENHCGFQKPNLNLILATLLS